MDRGFGSFRFQNNDRDRYSRDERRYDDFYDSNRRTSGGGSRNMNSNRANINRGNQGNWGGNTRDRGFGQGNVRGGGNVGVQMLASLQQQQHLLSAFMNSQGRRGGILETPPGQHRFQGNRGGGRGPNRAGDKRRMEQQPSGFKRSRQSSTQRKSIPSKPDKKEEVREPSPDIPDDEVVISDSLMDSVEKLRQRKDIERNVADEDVQKLLTFSYNGKGYQCTTCALFLSKEAGFHHHLMGKTHVMKVIEARSSKKYQEVRDLLDIDLVSDDWFEKSEKARGVLHKQAKAIMKIQKENERREQENYEKNPGNFFNVKMETKKSAMKEEDTVTITSLVESTIEIKDFAKDRFFGCEFVKAVTGFHCRLCNIHIKEASGVILHVDGRVHRNNYQVHLNKNKDYEKVQKEQNKELMEVLTQHENMDVLLYETSNANQMKFLGKIDAELVRDDKLLNPPEKKENEEKKEGDSAEEKKPEEDVENEEESKDSEKPVEGEPDSQEDQYEIEDDKDEVHENGDGAEAGGEEETEGNGDESVETEDVEMKPEEEKKEEVEEKKPKSILKKAAPKGKTPTPTRRGRGRGGKGGSTRSRRSKGKEEVTDEKEESNDSSFLDAFHVVDEVVEDY